MTKLKEFYAEAEKNEELKAALVKANEEMKGTTDQEAVKAKLIEIAKKFNYDLTEEDVSSEGELNMEDLENVVGAGMCFMITSAGCLFIGAAPKDCIAIGAVD